MPSVMQIIREMPSAASMIQSAAKRAGTKMMEVFAFVCWNSFVHGIEPRNTLNVRASFTGETPPNNLVAVSNHLTGMNSPSLPVIPCTMTG